MALAAGERETTFVMTDEEGVWLVYSSMRRYITKLKRNKDFVIEEEGVFDGTPFVRGTLVEGGIGVRGKSAGTGAIKRNVPSKKGQPMPGKKCKGKKADGSACGSVAGPTGFCFRHAKK